MSVRLMDVVGEALERARGAGADAAEAFAVRSRECEVLVRGDDVEKIDSCVSHGIGLRVFRGGRQGLAHTTEFTGDAMKRLAADAVGVARAAAPEPEAALPDEAITRRSFDEDLDLFDPAVESITMDGRTAIAREAEAGARAHPAVVNSEGSSFSDTTRDLVIANTNGLQHEHRATRCSVVSRPMASERSGAAGQARHWYSSARHLDDLEPPAGVGRKAAERAARMVGARPVATTRAAVIFDSLEAGRFWAGLCGAFSGESVRKRLSFLAGSLGRSIASESVTLIDDGTIPRGVGSAPRDGEGVPARRTVVIDRGVLRSFLYDCRTARKAAASTTGNASRAYHCLPGIGPSNFFLSAGPHRPMDLVRSTKRGLLVTHVMGFGINLTTGDYSRGAGGLWIENGEPTHAVQEVVISANIPAMLAAISMVADDLVLRSGVSSPSFRVDDVTISGR